MNELSKIKCVMEKVILGVLYEVILVLDGFIGQNVFEQVKQFVVVIFFIGLIIIKFDGIVKGGVVIGIFDQMNIFVWFIGVGEVMEDFQVFDCDVFVDFIFGN